MIWAFKIAIKMVVSRIVPYTFLRDLNLSRHGQMDKVPHALKIFKLHLDHAYPAGIPKELTILELGPGDSVLTCLISATHGVKKTYLVDVGFFAIDDVKFYKKAAHDLSVLGYDVPDLDRCKTLDDILKKCGCEYLKHGLDSLRKIPDNSVDFIWSHSVLEHVRKADLHQTFEELKRIAKPDSYSSHNIDFQDHLSHSLNNLRFSESLWEKDWFALRSGFYTNRVPAVTLHDMIVDAGFDKISEMFGEWPILPISRTRISNDYDEYTDKDLKKRTSHILLRA